MNFSQMQTKAGAIPYPRNVIPISLLATNRLIYSQGCHTNPLQSAQQDNAHSTFKAYNSVPTCIIASSRASTPTSHFPSTNSCIANTKETFPGIVSTYWAVCTCWVNDIAAKVTEVIAVIKADIPQISKPTNCHVRNKSCSCCSTARPWLSYQYVVTVTGTIR